MAVDISTCIYYLEFLKLQINHSRWCGKKKYLFIGGRKVAIEKRQWLQIEQSVVIFLYRRKRERISPTIKNCALKLATLGLIVGVS